MKDEIKKILEYLEKVDEMRILKILTRNEVSILLDYITNLQYKLSVTETNEETFRLEMEEITKILGLSEDALFDDVKEKATNLQEENERLKKICMR